MALLGGRRWSAVLAGLALLLTLSACDAAPSSDDWRSFEALSRGHSAKWHTAPTVSLPAGFTSSDQSYLSQVLLDLARRGVSASISSMNKREAVDSVLQLLPTTTDRGLRAAMAHRFDGHDWSWAFASRAVASRSTRLLSLDWDSAVIDAPDANAFHIEHLAVGLRAIVRFDFGKANVHPVIVVRSLALTIPPTSMVDRNIGLAWGVQILGADECSVERRSMLRPTSSRDDLSDATAELRSVFEQSFDVAEFVRAAHRWQMNDSFVPQCEA